MNDTRTLIITIGVIAAVAVMLGFVLPYLKRRGVDIERLIDQTKDALATVNKTLDIVRPFLTSAEVFDRIIEAAHVGVGNAEQLYHAGKLNAGERNAAARQYIEDSLRLIVIEVTPEVQRVIDGAIEAEVLALGHKAEV